MIQKIKPTLVKKMMKKLRKALTLTIVLVCSLTFMVVASDVSSYKVTTRNSTNSINISKSKSAPLEMMTQTELALSKFDLTETTAPVTKAQIELSKQVKTIPTLMTDLSKVMKLEILRVEYNQRIETKTVKFDEKTKRTNTLYVGQSKLSQVGVNGEKSIVYKDRFVNGNVEETTIVSETMTKEPIDRVMLIGNKRKMSKITFKNGLSPISDLKAPASLILNADGLPTNYEKIIDGTSTAYSGGGTTATGRPAMEGYIAVNPKQIPYGTRLYVVSSDGRYVYGYCIAADTGGFVQNNSCTIDIYLNTENECVQFGRRAVRIFVLD